MSTRWKPHVTVAAIMARDGRYLLVEEHTAQGLQLNTPAGHLERGESIVQACVREALEETAHAFTPTDLLGVYLTRNRHSSKGGDDGDITYLRFALCGEVGAWDAQRPLDEGIVRAIWLTPAEIEASQDRHRGPMVWQCVQDHLRGQRFPLNAVFTHPSVSDAQVRG